jgi:hypothetical protein
MRKEDNSTKPGTHFSEVWTNAQISRSVAVGAFFRNAWRRLFGSAARDDDIPVDTARRDLGT